MFNKKRIYEYLGDCDPLLNARASSRCGQTVTPCGEGGGTGGDPPIVPTFEIGTPVVMPFSVESFSVDCGVLSPTRYIVAISERGIFGNRRLLVSLVSVDQVGVTVAIQPEVTIENTLKNWIFVRVVVLSADRFIVLAILDGSPDKIYGIVCTINGNSVSYTSAQYLVDLPALAVEFDALNLRDSENKNKFLLQWWSTAGGSSDGRVSVVTVSDTDILTLETPDAIPSGAFSPQLVAMCDGHYDGTYRVSHFSASGVKVITSVYVYPDETTISVDGSSISLNLFGGNSFAFPVVPFGSSMFLVAGQASSGGADVRVINFSGSSILASTHTSTTRTLENLVLASVNGGRVFVLYSSFEGTASSRVIGLEMYNYNGSSLSLVYTAELDTVSCEINRALRVSPKGLSATKTPVVYSGRELGAGLYNTYTLVMEAGA